MGEGVLAGLELDGRAHGPTRERSAQQDPGSVGCVDPPRPERGQHTLARELVGDQGGESTGGGGQVGESRMSIVAVAAADEAEAVAAGQGVPHAVPRHG